jgi:DNA repair protein RadC
MNQYVQEARELLSYSGAESLDIPQLIAVITGRSCKELTAYSLSQLSSMSLHELMQHGLGSVSAARLSAAFALAKKINEANSRTKEPIRSAQDVYQICRFLEDKDREHFVAIYLNAQRVPIHRQIVFIGTLNACAVHPREVFKPAIRESAAFIIICHNHPSGSTLPSEEDIRFTQKLVDSGKILGIEVLDHIIIGKGTTYKSLKEEGYM